ncbi:MAG: dolichyl-phosphate mannose synthase [Lachnospiraceae bacterium]|nr:dolichyl-phosphate mannose synthase [Lachnospiraceae bacterium]
MKINLVMPMGGAGTRFLNNGYECPKPLIELKGQPFFKWACDSVYRNTDVGSLIFVVLNEHIEKYGIDKKIKEYYPEAKIEVLPHVLNGAVLTAMEGAKTIDNDAPLIFCDCDLAFKCRGLYDFYNAEKYEADGTLLTFKSDLDRYSYVMTGRLNRSEGSHSADKKDTEHGLTSDDNEIMSTEYAVKTAEKKVISSHAITGAYGFKNAELFLDAAKKYMDSCEYEEYFMSGIYNLLINDGRKIRVFDVDETVNFGTPDEYENAIASDLGIYRY